MTDIKSRVMARSDLNELRAKRNVSALTDALNADAPMVLVSRFITARTVLAECGVDLGSSILKKLKALAPSSIAIEVAVNFLWRDSGMDCGNDETQGMIDALIAGGAMTSEEGTALKMLAMRPLFVTQAEVADALYNPDGTEK